MAYVNVKDWSVDQVTEWLKGLDNVILPYTTSFLNNGMTGHQLLNLRADDLEHLGVTTLGHQEIILEAVELLRNIHFELDKENLQMLALRLSCASNSLYKELLLIDDDCSMVQTQTMSDVHNIIATIRPLVNWLERSPFAGVKDYVDNKTQLLQLSFEMATSAHRDIFSEKPVRTIRKICEKLAKMADHIIQESSDPMILQPASLDLATLKKKEQEIGFCIIPNNHAIHQISDIKYGSPAHASKKIEEGDEIVQVNYQTVVGWQRKKVLIILQESPPEIVLTLKKRPRHTKVYGQIYMKPYRLPSKKRDCQPFSRWNDGIPSPRLLPIHNMPPIIIPKPISVNEPPDVEISSSSSDSEPLDSPLDGSVRMYPLKPRPILQRRNTITGATPTTKRPYPSIEQYWKLWKNQLTSTHSSTCYINNIKFNEDSKFLRDKSASCNLGLDINSRPSTIINLKNRNSLKNSSFKNDFNNKLNNNCANNNKKKVNFQEKNSTIDINMNNNNNNLKKNNYLTIETNNLIDGKSLSENSLASLTNEIIDFIDEGRELTDRTSMIPIDNNNQLIIESTNLIIKKDVNIHDIIKKFDNQNKENNKETIIKPKVYPRLHLKKPPDVPQKPDKRPAVPPRSATTKLRGRLDKSHSTPAYDFNNDEIDKNHSDIITDIIDLNNKDELYTETKFELGIPINDTNNLLIEEKDDLNKDLPPKPPPRTFGLMTDITKSSPLSSSSSSSYYTDSPKIELNKNIKCGDITKQIFEFPDIINETISTPIIKLKDKSHNNQYFEPKSISTPLSSSSSSSLSKHNKIEFNYNESQKNHSNDNKISPTNSIVRAMIYSNKNKSGKKRNNLIAKRRKVSVNDFNMPDIQGYLYQRLRSKHNQNVHWEKRWFLLMGNCLYGFKNKDDSRAACLIFLHGFTVAIANEVKSRLNAFRVYHTGTAFYFSAEDSETLQSWLEMITAATLNSDSIKNNDNSLYSETDEEDNNEKIKQSQTDKSTTDSLKKFGSLKKFTSKKNNDSSSHNGSTSLDRKWFFNKSNNQTKNSIPVPTAQFRSYRKIRTNDLNSSGSVTTGNFTSHVALFAPRSEIPTLLQSQNISVPNLAIDPETTIKINDKTTPIITTTTTTSTTKSCVHSSNPSLCNGDFNIQNYDNNKTFKNENLSGFITLEEFMNRQTEERKNNPYNIEEDFSINFNLIKPDVVYGEVPIKSNKNDLKKIQIDENKSSCFGKRLGSLKKSHKDDNIEISTYPKIQKGFEQKLNRSLPRTHKLQENYRNKYDDTHYMSDRNLTTNEFKDRSYEMIYCPETITDIQFAQNRNLDDRMYHQDTPKKLNKLNKQHSFTSSDTNKKNSYDSNNKLKLKSALQYTPMCLPLNHHEQNIKPKLAFELNLDEKISKVSKFKQIFTNKQQQQQEQKKEKTFLGSPKLHRAIFKKGSTSSTIVPEDINSMPQSIYTIENLSTVHTETSPHNQFNISPHVDYSGLEYPSSYKSDSYSMPDNNSFNRK